jgi:hypothetical protein
MFSNNEPISFKMKQNILPQLQGKTLLVPSLTSLFPNDTIRQQRIRSLNNWILFSKPTVVTPFDSFEEEIMKGRVIIERASTQGSGNVIQSMDRRQETNNPRS